MAAPSLPAGLARRERALVAGLALFAALRVLLFSLAFPFFSNVDEYRHLDVVLKYARGEPPVPGPDRYEPETARLVALLGSPEYQRDAESPLVRELPTPTWETLPEVRERRLARMRDYLAGRFSLEADQPPVYYAAAGAWLALGRALGLEDGRLLYFVRALSAPAALALVWVLWWGLRDLYPERPLVRLGAPLLLAVFPHDGVYYVTGDAFSPLLGGLAFALALRVLLLGRGGAGLAAAAGAALATAFLCKYPSAALGVGAAVLSVGARAGAGRVALLWAVALGPPALWLARNAWAGAGLTGTAFKVEQLGWGQKPWTEWLDHPLFTVEGAWTFLRDLAPSFWRGELVWLRRDLAWAPADLVYGLVSALCLVGVAVAVARARPSLERRAEAAALATCAAAVAVLAGLSLLFVFGERTSPSATYPFFVQGRLVSGVFAPFALLVVRGFEEIARFAGRPALAWGLLLALAALALGSEAVLSAPVFASPYNAFHLP